MDDPQFIDSSAWLSIGDFLTWLVVFVLFVIGFGFNFLLAHSVIPSLVTTGHLPQRAEKLRPMFYVTALVAIVGAIVFLALTSSSASVIADVYERWWI